MTRMSIASGNVASCFRMASAHATDADDVSFVKKVGVCSGHGPDECMTSYLVTSDIMSRFGFGRRCPTLIDCVKKHPELELDL